MPSQKRETGPLALTWHRLCGVSRGPGGRVGGASLWAQESRAIGSGQGRKSPRSSEQLHQDGQVLLRIPRSNWQDPHTRQSGLREASGSCLLLAHFL